MAGSDVDYPVSRREHNDSVTLLMCATVASYDGHYLVHIFGAAKEVDDTHPGIHRLVFQGYSPILGIDQSTKCKHIIAGEETETFVA